MWRWRTASRSVLPTNALASSVSPSILESYLPSTPFEKRKTFLCAICISICWHWRHGKWIIGLMGNVGERGIEKDREKAAWKKKKKTAITGRFFLLPTTTTLHFTIHLSTTCVAEKIYLGLPFSLFLHNSLPQSFSRVHTNALTLSHPYSSSVSLAPSVTHSMALIHQLALRADNGLFHIAKEKEKQIERERTRASERLLGFEVLLFMKIYLSDEGHWWSLMEDEVLKWCSSA